MSFTTQIRSLINDAGFDIVRHVPDLNRPFDVLPLLVRERVARREPCFFVQIGANDGVLDDPLRDLIVEHDLPGILVEPLPDTFTRLVSNYFGQPNLIFENVAIADAPGVAPIYRVKADAEVPPGRLWYGIASFDQALLFKEGIPEDVIERVDIEATTIPALLAKHRISRVDLVQIDTEGLDDTVVKAVLDAGLRPSIINYEHCHLTPQRRLESKRLLDRSGYQFIEVGYKDTLAIRRS